MRNVTTDIETERRRQDAKFGVQSHPDGTDPSNAHIADIARQTCKAKAWQGNVTWADILREEFHEAMAEVEWEKLRAELVQVAAVAVAWIEDGDKRATAPETSSEETPGVFIFTRTRKE